MNLSLGMSADKSADASADVLCIIIQTEQKLGSCLFYCALFLLIILQTDNNIGKQGIRFLDNIDFSQTYVR